MSVSHVESNRATEKQRERQTDRGTHRETETDRDRDRRPALDVSAGPYSGLPK